MSDFTKQSELSNQNRLNIVSSFDATSRSTFFAAQRSKIVDIVAAAIRAIQMQQFISSSIFAARYMTQKFTLTEFIKK
jgi:hypothetical protein